MGGDRRGIRWAERTGPDGPEQDGKQGFTAWRPQRRRWDERTDGRGKEGWRKRGRDEEERREAAAGVERKGIMQHGVGGAEGVLGA